MSKINARAISARLVPYIFDGNKSIIVSIHFVRQRNCKGRLSWSRCHTRPRQCLGNVETLSDAHKTPSVATNVAPAKRPTSLADSRAAADAAREERDQWLRDAHKERPPRKRMPWGWAFGDEANGTSS
jgi:hypothetical protein